MDKELWFQIAVCFCYAALAVAVGNLLSEAVTAIIGMTIA